MLRSLTLKNFRCFQSFTIEPLERINLISGKNNVGKTSLLEAIFISINPIGYDAVLRIEQIRSLASRDRFKTLEEWRNIFYEQELERTININTIEQSNIQRSLKIFMANEMSQMSVPLFQEDETIPFRTNESLMTGFRKYDGLVFEYEYPNGVTRNFLRADGRAQKSYPRFPEGFPFVGIYITTNTRSHREDAERFSNLERVGKQDEIVKALRLLEPRLQRLTLLLVGRGLIVHGDIGMRELVPLTLMGEGMGRLLSIILAIATARGGIVLIDEIENGLHYSVLVDVWRAIADAARRSDVQIFATTHSYECILAAHKAFETSEKYDFRYHRLEQVNNDIQAITYDRETLATSDEMNLEMR
ncbi:MAG: DNA replication and repair protein RecF [Chroococcidiopsis cubana SAG 39.79]|jgi:predicted ATPase|uniref:ATPase-like protein n=1 Tax=Chroococcidiopsis thermalis (strain PCC 7203) TaxID=251229 RepID=K9U5J0_CHRTP|nr:MULTISPECIES: ATP-binding protein [Chroococcidiopsis]AFY90100.1 ATPase-like protein [Chroococcidiopsis thermalis PCC 7203]MDZ4876252.1 DNA replication and repair protein RecF [Chroococcidiopsis cubana SAG 39.79]PSB40933.1 ATPase [Cyanosarcina cf. burmensis CCALA 770]PSB63470.1 ATPase [Chroococcidiopsis cubana CCALA 043]